MKKISRFAVLLFCLLASVALLLVFYIIRMASRPDLASPAICLILIIVVFVLVVAIICIQLVNEKNEREALGEGEALAEEEAPAEEEKEEAPVAEAAPAEEEKEESKEEAPTEEEAPAEEAGPAPTEEELAAIKAYERLQRSFLAKLAKADESVRDNYSELKNAFLSYKKVRSRMSFKCETVKSGRNMLAKMQVRGKSLVVFFALEPADLEGKKYKTQEAPTSKAYQAVPVKFRVNSPRKLKQAKEMVDLIAAKFECKQKPHYEPVDFKAELPALEADAEMEAKGLIKVKR